MAQFKTVDQFCCSFCSFINFFTLGLFFCIHNVWFEIPVVVWQVETIPECSKVFCWDFLRRYYLNIGTLFALQLGTSQGTKLSHLLFTFSLCIFHLVLHHKDTPVFVVDPLALIHCQVRFEMIWLAVRLKEFELINFCFVNKDCDGFVWSNLCQSLVEPRRKIASWSIINHYLCGLQN